MGRSRLADGVDLGFSVCLISSRPLTMMRCRDVPKWARDRFANSRVTAKTTRQLSRGLDRRPRPFDGFYVVDLPGHRGGMGKSLPNLGLILTHRFPEALTLGT